MENVSQTVRLSKESILELAEVIAKSVVSAIKQENIGGIGGINSNASKNANEKTELPDKSAYAKTEALLSNYMTFKRIVKERMEEIEDIKKYGVPDKRDPFGERVHSSPVNGGIVLEEESVESAVHKIYCAIRPTVQAISMVDKGMESIKGDYYYGILEMLYFEQRTQEAIALEYGCSQVTISNNKNRLVKELSMILFPDQVVEEILR